MLPDLTGTIVEWKSKGLPNKKKIDPLLQEIITFTPRNVVNLFCLLFMN